MTTASNIKKIGVSVIAIAIMAGAYFGVTASNASALTSLSNLNSGDLIRGESFAAVYYYGADGFRYVFPNSKAYDTWYSNFDNIKWISDAELGQIQIGGNVTYKPGVRMVKINTDPKTYAVTQGGTLRHVTTEQVAIDLYGANWNQHIDDIPDGFFGNYNVGTAINDSATFVPASEAGAATSVNWDKSLSAPAVISMTDNGYSPIDVTISAGDSVKWVNNGTAKHTVTGDDLSWGSGTKLTGENFIKTFDEVGTYPFFDSYDGANTGAVYVQ